MTKELTYKDSGVDIEAGDEAVRRIKALAKRTHRPEVLGGVGGFGGLFQLDLKNIAEPVLVSSIDSVGTKLKIAFMMNKHDTVGEDIVNHCVNDIMVCGAKPLFFMDYIAMGKLRPAVVEEIIKGIARGCRNSGCTLLGGETAEMPDFYQQNEYDLVGSIIGIAEKSKIIDGKKIKKGDVLIGLPSNGLHTNGFSLARKVLFEVAKFRPDTFIEELGCTLGEELLKVHKCYLQEVRKLQENGREIKGLSHITGGGIVGNTSRILAVGLSLKINWGTWSVPPIFNLIQEIGNVADSEMRKTFNLGVGLIVIVAKDDVNNVLVEFEKMGEKAFVVGEVV